MNAFTALAVDARREIVFLVARHGALTSTEISRNFKMTAPAISQHLKVLQQADILRMRKDAQKRIYSLNEPGLGEIRDWLSGITTLWNRRLDSLEKHLMKKKQEKKP